MQMLKRIPAETLYVSRPTGWLTSRFHFSFADYFNPQNVNFGVLRVLNDDLVKPHSGFSPHPHRDQEIFSYIVDGQLTHEDSAGHRESLGRGAVQYMSAGRGVVHSEMNNGDETCRFLQIWITPNQRGLPVQYGSHKFAEAERRNVLLPIIRGKGRSSQDVAAPITLNQDCNVYVSEFDRGVPLHIEIGDGRQAYMVCIEGSTGVSASREGEDESVNLDMRDAAEIRGPTTLQFASATDKAHILLVEMAQS